MTDKEILDWLQDNIVRLWQNCDETYTMSYIDGGEIRAASLRECVEKAAK